MAITQRIHRWTFLAAVCVGLSSLAQDVPKPATGGDDQSSHDDKATPPGVSVPDSPGATERLDKAREKENQKQWKTAAEYYQEALSKYGGRVVPVRRDPDQGIYQYSGIAAIVQERMAKWPEEGLKIYRGMVGSTAADLLTNAQRGDTAALGNVFWNYFVTDAGKSAGIALIDAYMESGDFQAAAWIGDRLLTLHPALAADKSLVTYRTALAYFWAGDSASAQRLLASLKQSGPTDVGNIAGKDVILVDSLSQMLANPPLKPTTRPTDADTYPSFGGLGERGDVSPSTAKPGASLTQVVFTPPDTNGLMGTQKSAYQDSDKNSLISFAAMGVMPVVDAGALFFQDGRCLYAVDADTGAPLPGWLSTYGGDRLGRYKLNIFGRARNELLTVSVTPSSVLAIMGQPDRNSQNNPQQMNGWVVQQNVQTNSTSIKLVCLDRDSGKENWTRTPADLPDSVAVLHSADYVGTPLVIPASIAGRGPGGTAAEDSVLAVARGGKDNQFDDCYVVCLSLKTGQYRWSTYVGSATRNFDADGTSSVQPSQMALADGRVFISTNLGTVAAMDPADGRIIWLNSYARDTAENPEAMFLRGRGRFMNNMQPGVPASEKPWAYNPVFVNGGHVFVLPNDTHQLFVYDEASGMRTAKLPMSAFNSADVLLGITDGAVCLTSDKDLYVVDWKRYREDRPVEKCVRWSRLMFTNDSEKEPNTVCGRGFLTADSIYIPSKNRIYQISMARSGKIAQEYPKHGSFTGNQGPGNVLVTANNVVVAGQTQLDVYTDLNLVRRRFETAMSAAPTDPMPRMEYAEALFNGGQTKDAITRVDEAINLIGGMDAMRPGKDRAMIFANTLSFARRTVKNGSTTNSAETVDAGNAFFDRAAAAADSPVEKATYRLERAKFEHQNNNYANEVKLCQQILSDDAMRGAVLENDISAATAAETAIDVASSLDHTSYADIEQQAQTALTAARSANDPDQLMLVATIYPNSKAAIDARQDAVHRYEAANQPDKAIDVLRRMYASTSDSGDRANVLVSIANDYLTSPGGIGPAVDRLCRASRISPYPKLTQKLRLPDGTTLSDATYVQVIAQLRQMDADQQNAALPDFHLAAPRAHVDTPFVIGPTQPDKNNGPFSPLKSTPDSGSIPNISALVHPLHDYRRTDQILTWSAAGLSIFKAGETTPLATVAAVDKQPLGAAWAHDNWIVWSSTQIFQVSADGKTVWNFSVAGLPTLLVSSGRDTAINDAGDPSNDVAGSMPMNGINGQVQIQQNGVIIRRRFGGGNVVIQPQPAVPVLIPHNGDEEIVSVIPASSQGTRLLVTTSTGRVAALDGRSGQIVWQTRPADHAVDQLLANPHFTVARMDDPGGSLITLFDTATGRVIGRRLYGPDGSQRQLVNVALSEEATLAVTLTNQLLVKDLYEPWKTNFTELVAQANRDNAPYIGLNQPDQLLIRGGRLACLYGSAEYARGYDLSHNTDPTNPLATRSATVAVSLRMVGSRLFITTADRIHQYNLADPAIYPGGSGSPDHYEQDPGIVSFPPKVRGMLLGKDYAVVVNDSVDRGPLGSPWTTLVCYSRELIPGKTRERGNAVWGPEIRSEVGITDWLGSEGAIYYLTKDNTLHLLKGARS